MKFAKALIALSILFAFQGAQAQQAYPNRPVRLVIMFAPGSNSDVNGRYVAIKLGEQLGVPFVVESKPGGGGVIALREVFRAQPLGYSLLLSNNNAFVGNTVTLKDPGYRIDDYAPVGVLGQTPYAMTIHESVPVNSVPEFVAWAKTRAGKINYGALGPASGNALNAERLKQLAGIDMTPIHYKGGDLLVVDHLSGNVQVTWATVGQSRIRLQNKQLKGLAVTGDERSKILPSLPTFREVGYPDMDAVSSQFLLAPAAMPAAMLARQREAYVKASGGEEWRKRMESIELEPFNVSNEEFMARSRKDAARLAAEYKRLNIPQE